MLDQPQTLQSQNQIQIQQMRQVTSSAISGYSSLLSNIAESNSNSLPFNSDPELSDLLEEVMDIMNVTSGKIFLKYIILLKNYNFFKFILQIILHC